MANDDEWLAEERRRFKEEFPDPATPAIEAALWLGYIVRARVERARIAERRALLDTIKAAEGDGNDMECG